MRGREGERKCVREREMEGGREGGRDLLLALHLALPILREVRERQLELQPQRLHLFLHGVF